MREWMLLRPQGVRATTWLLSAGLGFSMRHAPSADRNKAPVADALHRFPPFSNGGDTVNVLEIASGTGQHVSFLAARWPHITFWPTEYGGGASGPEATAHESLDEVFASIVAHCTKCPNVHEPIELDAGALAWPDAVEATKFSAVYASNLCHIAPYAVTEGLLRGAARVLSSGGGLFIYGPFKVGGQHTAPSNEAFDARLRENNAEWGVRDSSELEQLGAQLGLRLVERVAMPANNLVLYFVRGQDRHGEA